MKGCDDTDYVVTVLVANTYRVTAGSKEEAISKGTRKWLDGEKAPSVMPRATEVEVLGPRLIYGNERHGNE